MRKALLLLPSITLAIVVMASVRSATPTEFQLSAASFSFSPPVAFASAEIAAVLQPEQVVVQQEIPVVVPPPAAPPIVDEAVVNYLLKNTPPDQLIRYYFRFESPQVIERMLYIACREGGMGKDRTRNLPPHLICLPQNRVPAVPYDGSCGADNPTSTASGLFQYLISWKNWGGYSWGLIVNHDCLEDVKMTYDVWKLNGFKHWS